MRNKELIAMLPKPLDRYEGEYRNNFNNYARYMGNGVYSWKGIYSTDTQELYLLGVLHSEGIKVVEEEEEDCG